MSTKTKPIHPKLKSKPNPDGSPRYKPGTHAVYDEEYQLRFKSSWILNGSARVKDLKNAGRLYDVPACKAVLRELTGEGKDNPGYYKEYDTWFRARIPNAEEQLKNIHAEHKRWQREQIRFARSLELPKWWPDDLLQKRLKAEAALDCYLAEKNKVEKRIEELKARDKKEEEKSLPHGPISTQFNPKAGEIDGQAVDILSGELPVPYICDDRSPYFGMTVVGYIEMAKQWKTTMRLTPDLLREDGKKLFKEQKAEHEKESEKPFPFSKMAFTPRQMFERRIKEITKKDWPERPKGSTVDELKPKAG